MANTEPSSLVLGPDSTSIGSAPVCAYHLQAKVSEDAFNVTVFAAYIIVHFARELRSSTLFEMISFKETPLRKKVRLKYHDTESECFFFRTSDLSRNYRVSYIRLHRDHKGKSTRKPDTVKKKVPRVAAYIVTRILLSLLSIPHLNILSCWFARQVCRIINSSRLRRDQVYVFEDMRLI